MLGANSKQLSATEEKTVQRALQEAHQREISALIAHVRDRAASLTEIGDLWYLHDLLSTKRYEIDGKYVYNSDTFIFDCARLVQEGWLTLQDLKGLPSETLFKMSALARM